MLAATDAALGKGVVSQVECVEKLSGSEDRWTVPVAEGEPRGLRSTFLSDLETNAQGEAWLMAPNWEMVQRTARVITREFGGKPPEDQKAPA